MTARGITLIEMLIVMGILAVAMALVGPSTSAGLDNLMLTSAGQQIVSTFRAAQTNARATGEPIFGTYTETDIRFIKADRVYQTVVFPRGVRVVATQEPATVVFLE